MVEAFEQKSQTKKAQLNVEMEATLDALDKSPNKTMKLAGVDCVHVAMGMVDFGVLQAGKHQKEVLLELQLRSIGLPLPKKKIKGGTKVHEWKDLCNAFKKGIVTVGTKVHFKPKTHCFNDCLLDEECKAESGVNNDDNDSEEES